MSKPSGNPAIIIVLLFHDTDSDKEADSVESRHLTVRFSPLEGKIAVRKYSFRASGGKCTK
jgi:hypothetical protein